jgi:hypothetical protein
MGASRPQSALLQSHRDKTCPPMMLSFLSFILHDRKFIVLSGLSPDRACRSPPFVPGSGRLRSSAGKRVVPPHHITQLRTHQTSRVTTKRQFRTIWFHPQHATQHPTQRGEDDLPDYLHAVDVEPSDGMFVASRLPVACCDWLRHH